MQLQMMSSDGVIGTTTATDARADVLNASSSSSSSECTYNNLLILQLLADGRN